MRIGCELRVVALAVLAIFALAAPHYAHAATTTTDNMCNDGTYDQTVENNRNAVVQADEKLVVNITDQFPVVDASNACVQGIINVLQSLANPQYSDPLNFLGPLLTNMVVGILDQACSAVMGSVTQAEGLVSNKLSVCFPMPNFSLNFNALNLTSQPCSGGTQFNLINGFSAPPNTLSSTSGYLQH